MACCWETHLKVAQQLPLRHERLRKEATPVVAGTTPQVYLSKWLAKI
jgi:hypothetical protein